jgi:DNA invertase Pin-like site-specific DNA recombinase
MTIARDDAWIYARRSRKSDTHASVEAQTERALDEITQHGWRHAGTLDEEISASRFARKDREAWPKLLELIKDGKVGVVVLWESNRGDRTLESWAGFLELCRVTGTRIYVITHEHLYDLNIARDWETLASEGVKNHAFSNQLSSDISRGKRLAMRRGRAQGPPPYGYRAAYNPDTGKTAGWEIAGDQAAIVREVIARAGASVPMKEIARDLNERGVPTRTGAAWDATTVRGMARNPAYAGLLLLPDGTLAERQEQADGARWPAIVERGEHEAAVAVLDGRASGSRPGRVTHLMGNLAACDCGQMIHSHGRANYACRAGHMVVRGWWLDEIVSFSVKAYLRKPAARDAFETDSGPRAARLRAELDALGRRRKRYVALAADGDEDADDVLAELRPKITAARRELDAVTIVPALRELLTAEDMDEAWKSLTVQARRAAISAVTGVTVARVPKGATREQRDDEERVQFDWQPQDVRRRPRGDAG